MRPSSTPMRLTSSRRWFPTSRAGSIMSSTCSTQSCTDRYARLARFIEHLFGRIERLQEPGFHPKWKDVNVNAAVPGLERSAAAQEWVDHANGPGAEVAAHRPLGQTDLVQIRNDARAAAGSNTEAHRLFREFMEWRRQRR